MNTATVHIIHSADGTYGAIEYDIRDNRVVPVNASLGNKSAEAARKMIASFHRT
jgi:hypothetical protein